MKQVKQKQQLFHNSIIEYLYNKMKYGMLHIASYDIYIHMILVFISLCIIVFIYKIVNNKKIEKFNTDMQDIIKKINETNVIHNYPWMANGEDATKFQKNVIDNLTENENKMTVIPRSYYDFSDITYVGNAL